MPRPRPLERPPPLPTFGPSPDVLLCNLCLVQASNEGQLKRHIAHNHPGPRQPCGSCLEGPKAQMSRRLKAAEEEAKLFQAELPPILAPPHPRVRVRNYVSYMLRPDLISDQAGINSRVYALLDLEGREIHCSANLPWCPKRP